MDDHLIEAPDGYRQAPLAPEPEEPKLPESIKARELCLKVFDNPNGIALIDYWMSMAGITAYMACPNQEAMIRRDELQRFMHSILQNLAMTPDQIRASAIARHQQRIEHTVHG
jgi:hypothetical protein